MRATAHPPVRRSHPSGDPVVLGRYRVGALIGAGATARVHRGRDTVTGETVAIKEVVLGDAIARRVHSEVRATSRLDHPSIARLRDWGEDADSVFLVWDLVDGPALSQVLAGARPPDAAEMASIVADVLEGLAHAHARGVVHRDVKPANILVGSDGRARLVDFGVALLSDETRVTQVGASVGTIAYMSPEQATGGESTGATDVFGACLVLYEGLAGRNPLATGNAAATAQRAADCRIPDLARLRPGLPADLISVVRDGLSPNPAGRPSAAEAARRLRAAVDAMRGARGTMARLRERRRAALVTAGLAVSGGALGAQMVALPAAVATGLATGALAMFAPLLAVLCLVGGLVTWVGLTAPGMAVALGLGALLVVPTVGRRRRLLAAPMLAPVLFAVGAGLIYALIAGGLARRGERIWAAIVGCAAAAWVQIWSGGSGLLLSDVAVAPARVALEGDARPSLALERSLDPILAAPASLGGVLLVGAMALLVPAVRSRRAGGPRLIAAAAWAIAGISLAAALPGVGGGPATGGVIVVLGALAWASWPPRIASGRRVRQPSGTLGEIR